MWQWLEWWWLAPAVWASSVLVLLLGWAPALWALWREPVLRRPVLIFESDDWGAGPGEQTEALHSLRTLLCRHRDATARPAVMTLALVLARAEAGSWRAGHYCRRELDHPDCAPVLHALHAGRQAGCFALQLHGYEHYWPPALWAAAGQDARLGAWLDAPGEQTESLPPALQSRWTDASRLPSRALAEADIAAAVTAEVAAYRRCLGEQPRVVVPPTFIWDARVERAWAAEGLKTLVTPGERYAARDARGRPAGAWGRVLNGQAGQGGLRYLVRDVYFEPALGHRAEGMLEGLASHTHAGRPTLVETHRFNFLGAAAEASLQELDRALTLARRQQPGLRFLSTAHLAEALLRGDPEWCAQGLRARVRALCVRMQGLRRFWRLARLLGLAPLLVRLGGGMPGGLSPAGG